MKFIISSLLLLSAVSAFAAKEVRIELISNDAFEFQEMMYGSADYRATNPTCVELYETHILPVPMRRTTYRPAVIQSDRISSEKSLGGYCQYKLSKISAKLAHGDKAVSLMFHPRADAPNEVTIYCTTRDILICRLDDDYSFGLHVPVSSTGTTKLNVIYE